MCQKRPKRNKTKTLVLTVLSVPSLTSGQTPLIRTKIVAVSHSLQRNPRGFAMCVRTQISPVSECRLPRAPSGEVCASRGTRATPAATPRELALLETSYKVRLKSRKGFGCCVINLVKVKS